MWWRSFTILFTVLCTSYIHIEYFELLEHLDLPFKIKVDKNTATGNICIFELCATAASVKGSGGGRGIVVTIVRSGYNWRCSCRHNWQDGAEEQCSLHLALRTLPGPCTPSHPPDSRIRFEATQLWDNVMFCSIFILVESHRLRHVPDWPYHTSHYPAILHPWIFALQIFSDFS